MNQRPNKVVNKNVEFSEDNLNEQTGETSMHLAIAFKYTTADQEERNILLPLLIGSALVTVIIIILFLTGATGATLEIVQYWLRILYVP